ncbi:MAG: hypothetical protein M1823_007196, partial [Watsoniomyces obsoletus]
MSLTMQPEPAIKERRSSSIFRLPFRSKKDKPADRSQSVSHRSGMRTPPHRNSLDERQHNSASYARSGLRQSITDKYGTVYDVSQVSTNRTGSNWSSYPTIAVGDSYERDKQTGEVIDHTDMLHSLAPTESQEDAPILQRMQSYEGTEPGQTLIDRFPSTFWDRVVDALASADLAALSLSCKAFEHL